MQHLHEPSAHARREMRWFLLADVPRELRPRGRGGRRTDHYHLPTLSPHTALKWRGAPRRLEQKVRVGRVELETWCGVPGFVERWSKQRVPQRRGPTARDWRAVSKEVWVADGVEIARVSIEGHVVWTYCVDLDVACEPGRSSFRSWRPLLVTAEANSYAGFLARRVSRRSERLAS